MFLRFLACGALSFAACFALPPRTTPCTADNSCAAGAVKPEDPSFDITAIDGDGVMSNGAHSIATGIVLSGLGLDAVEGVEFLRLTGESLGGGELSEQSATSLHVGIPAGVEAVVTTAGYELQLRATHPRFASRLRTIRLTRGASGGVGAMGSAAQVLGSSFVSAAAGQLSLIVPAGCAAGDVLKVVSGQWGCADDLGSASALVTGITGGTGVLVSANGSTVTVSLRPASSAADANGAALANHTHYGSTFAGSTDGAGFTVINTQTASSAATRIGGIEGVNQVSQTGGANFSGVRGDYGTGSTGGAGVGVYGRSESAQGGVGVAGFSAGYRGRGISGWVDYTVAGISNWSEEQKPAALQGEAKDASAIGVMAVNTDPNGVALRTKGRSDLRYDPNAGVQLPIIWRTAVAASQESFIDCNNGVDAYGNSPGPGTYTAIGGGCYTSTTGIVTASHFADTISECSTTVGGTPSSLTSLQPAFTGYKGYCCRLNNSAFVSAMVTCLRVK